MPELNEANIINAFEELIVGAAGRATEYLRAVTHHIRQERIPVTAAVRDVTAPAGLTGRSYLGCLVLTPNERRIRHYMTMHYAVDMGTALQVGWYLVGGERAMGMFDMPVLGGPSGMDVDKVRSIVDIIQSAAVEPAVQEMIESNVS